MRGRSPLSVLVPLVLTLLAAGCGGDGNGAAACPPPGLGTEPRELTGAVSDVTFLTAVSVDRTRCGDRVAFEFRDELPGVRVDYQPRERALVEDGSGNRLDAAGDAFLVVRLTPAVTAEAEGDQLTLTYTGPRRLRPDDARFIREVIKTGDFEAAVTWVIALDEERPFRVAASERRLAVELG
jgi:hypothetical protein